MHPYATVAFAESLAHWGKPFEVPEWGGGVMLREISAGLQDAAGIYPITPLNKNADIAGGLARLRDVGLVSVVLVLDDFHRLHMNTLKEHFDTVDSFKPHYLYRPEKGEMIYGSHHKRAVKTAYKHVKVDVLDLRKHVHEWAELYDALIAKLGLSGLHAFPLAHHQQIAGIQGMVAIGAWMGDELVSCHIWADDGEYVHSHLVASNDKGYESRAAYAVNDTSLRYFSGRKLLNFGGGAGNSVGSDDGLARFKKGFSNDTAESYICGAILDKEKYQQLVNARKFNVPVRFFPAYRAP
ncbi:MAG: hypothetical protein ACK502_01975 [Alphaproteobacteria bacterium]|jgi:hypothetical protein